MHRARVETRRADITGHQLPTWQDVEKREYEQWTTASVTIDTALQSVDECVEDILEALSSPINSI